jgi:hypothetical protein
VGQVERGGEEELSTTGHLRKADAYRVHPRVAQVQDRESLSLLIFEVALEQVHLF